jgi:hypothetical protein
VTGLVRLLLSASLLCVGCSRTSTPQEQARAGDEVAEHARVRAMLYDQGLIEDAEVQAKMSEYVVRMERDSVPRERAYREFGDWLEAWARSNTERARTARARRGVDSAEGM